MLRTRQAGREGTSPLPRWVDRHLTRHRQSETQTVLLKLKTNLGPHSPVLSTLLCPGSSWGYERGCEGSVPASPCFSSIAQLKGVKGRSECATHEAIPLWLAYFSERFLFREQSPPSQKPAASVGLVMGRGAPPNVSLPWDLRRAL